MRLVVADDVMIVRAGLVRLLTDAGMQVDGEASDAAQLLRLVAVERPDVAIVDIRMPPTHRDEGLVAAREIRTHYPDTAVLVLSQYLATRYAERLLADQPASLGYLLKERVSDVDVLTDAVRRVAAGGCVIDPTIVQRLLGRTGAAAAGLTPRERDVLALMAEGRSNAAIAQRLGIRERTVEAACAQIFAKLGLPPDPDANRRVLAVIKVLRGA
ncbi:response regulator transcription factor [Phytohabitans sp. LJ34]|uniref:response regulator transcription factor n=1 Tax=Phytohabitans sp. LJ34 TaxID=3452217 RepID=UPI003F8C3A73